MALLTCRTTASSSEPSSTAPVGAAARRVRRAGSGGGGGNGGIFTALLAFPAAAAVGTALLVVLLVANSLPARGQAYLPATMTDAMEAALFLNRFMDAADATGYYDRFLDADFSGTVFAPVDLGFDALLQKTNATWDELTAPELNDTLSAIVGLHIVPGQRVFPLSSVREGTELTAASGGKLYVRRDVPGITHIYAVRRPEDDPLNFATILQYQEIRGGKAILYVVDKVLLPPAKTSSAPTTPASTSNRRRGGDGTVAAAGKASAAVAENPAAAAAAAAAHAGAKAPASVAAGASKTSSVNSQRKAQL
ncbi:hypothetical protein Vretifemale_12481 [Volvox reticuliferus]|uniref:FAS1 domain-containing protein n=1 Tax=Volvox reticuliferus TaxID=1737510 RepID=A0A8J4FS62_9CHLO|nr:hypothetical protein Vretifemale_12481 [Volvox reticuliferus]